jgi:hypothetical protein
LPAEAGFATPDVAEMLLERRHAKARLTTSAATRVPRSTAR